MQSSRGIQKQRCRTETTAQKNGRQQQQQQQHTPTEQTPAFKSTAAHNSLAPAPRLCLPLPQCGIPPFHL